MKVSGKPEYLHSLENLVPIIHRYVLPNHFLFQLAEQPPADLAALLKSFPSVPPVIRRRAKELLDVIRGCLTSHLTNVSTPSASASQGPAPVLVDEAETSHPTPKANVASCPSLWIHDHCQYTFRMRSVAGTF
jgi:exosome complex exonuclease RRP6